MNRETVKQTLLSLVRTAPLARGTYELLHELRLQQRRARMLRLAKGAGWLGAGAVLGSGLAALLSPYDGRKMRREVGHQAQRMGDYLKSDNPEDRS